MASIRSVDLGTAEGCAQAVAETERRLGPVDLLIVNHGIGSAHERLVWEQDPEVWRETMRINLDAPFELARLTVGGMCKRGFGRLDFTSSTAGEKAERIRERLHGFQARGHRTRARGRTGCWAVRRHIERSTARLGANRNGRAPSAKAESVRRGISVEQVWSERAAIYPQKARC